MTQVNNISSIWGRSLKLTTKPFDVLSSKHVKISSIYSPNVGFEKSQSILIDPIIKAVHEYIDLLKDDNKNRFCSIGSNGDDIYIERSIKDLNTAQLLIYNKASGKCQACNYNILDEESYPYQLNGIRKPNGSIGTAIFLALMPVILEDNEAIETFQKYKLHLESTFEIDDTLLKLMAILCDNVYQRIISGAIKLNVSDSMPVKKITTKDILSKRLAPSNVILGTFKIFNIKESKKVEETQIITIKPNEYNLSLSRELTKEEEKQIIKISKSHRVTQEEVRICKEIKRNWNKKDMKIVNILLEGDAGSGKTQLAKALSYDLGLPYTKITCFADMDKSDVIGSILPVISDDDIKSLDKDDANLLRLVYESSEDDSVYDILAKEMGCSKEDVKVKSKWKYLQKLSKEKSSENSVRYKFFPSEIVRAFKYGYLLEIQEPTVIRDAAVLMSLNSALELDGSINLPTEVVSRHPDFVSVITTNRNYVGCRPLNEALRDRVQHTEKMDLPSKEVIVQRAMAKTGCDDIELTSKLADAIIVLDETAKANAIRGVAGMRSLFYWLDAVQHGDSIRESMYNKVIYKMTTDPDEIILLEDAVENNTSLFIETRRRR